MPDASLIPVGSDALDVSRIGCTVVKKYTRGFNDRNSRLFANTAEKRKE